MVRSHNSSGLFPAVFGGEMENVKTASGYAMARDQALGRLGLVWRRLKDFYGDVMLLSVDCFRKNRPNDVEIPFLGAGGNFESKFIRLADLKGNILERPEVAAVVLVQFLLTEELARQRGDQVAQGVVNLTFAELLIDVIHPNGNIRHFGISSQMLSAKAGSRYLKKEKPASRAVNAKPMLYANQGTSGG